MGRRRAVAVAALAALATSACTGGHGGGGPRPGGASSARSPGPAAAGGGGARDRRFELAGYASASASVPGTPVASAPTSVQGVELQVYLVRRDGGAVLVVFGLHNTGGQRFVSGVPASVLGEGPLDLTVGGVSLVDTAGLQQYLVLRPADWQQRQSDAHPGPCACSLVLAGGLTRFEAGEVKYFAAEVSAPPAAVAQVSLTTPLGTVPGLRLEGA